MITQRLDDVKGFDSEPVIWLLVFSTLLVLVLVGLNFLFFQSLVTVEDLNKRTPYECGFTAFDDARIRFDVRYYLVAILFLLFDVELIFLFPWAVLLPYLNTYGFGVIEFFMILLTLGFIFEYSVNALDGETV